MKILLVSLFLPQQKARHAGGRYVFEILRMLSGQHEIHLATRLEENEVPLLESLGHLCKKIYPYTYRTTARRRIQDKMKLVMNYIGFSRHADRINREHDFDLVQVEWVEAGLLIKKRRAPMVLDAHDVISKPAERAVRMLEGISRLLAFLKYVLVRAIELKIMKKFDLVLTLSEFDRKYLLEMKSDLNVMTIPIPAGLDITDKIYEGQKNTILFLASYKYRKVNVDAALYFYRQVFPLIRERIPDARFIAAGYGPPAELTSISEGDPDVTVPGFVDDIDRCYKEAAVFVAPILTGGGIIVKILDAMAAGVPVVTTSFGNEGIGAVPDRDLLVADTPERFAEAVVRLLTDRDIARQIAENGREFVREHYSLESVAAKLEAAYDELSGKAWKA